MLFNVLSPRCLNHSARILCLECDQGRMNFVMKSCSHWPPHIVPFGMKFPINCFVGVRQCMHLSPYKHSEIVLMSEMLRVTFFLTYIAKKIQRQDSSDSHVSQENRMLWHNFLMCSHPCLLIMNSSISKCCISYSGKGSIVKFSGVSSSHIISGL